jgi:hypothetical protein
MDFRINWHGSTNFGDQLNPYLVDHFMGFIPEKYQIWNEELGFHEYLKDPHIMLLGSILNEANRNTTVLGAGFVSLESYCLEEPHFISVRGKLTRDKIFQLYGEKDSIFLGDPALSMPLIYNPSVNKKYKLGIIPHLIDEWMLSDIQESIGQDIKIISLRTNEIKEDIERIIREIKECEMTISSSLHGLITSHTYGVPSLWVEFSDGVIGNGFKFRDYLTTHLNKEELKMLQNPIDLRQGVDHYTISEIIKLGKDFPNVLNIEEMNKNYKFYKNEIMKWTQK